MEVLPVMKKERAPERERSSCKRRDQEAGRKRAWVCVCVCVCVGEMEGRRAFD
jgi:hypothetical protein